MVQVLHRWRRHRGERGHRPPPRPLCRCHVSHEPRILQPPHQRVRVGVKHWTRAPRAPPQVLHVHPTCPPQNLQRVSPERRGQPHRRAPRHHVALALPRLVAPSGGGWRSTCWRYSHVGESAVPPWEYRLTCGATLRYVGGGGTWREARCGAWDTLQGGWLLGVTAKWVAGNIGVV